jgi:hypothetical protein
MTLRFIGLESLLFDDILVNKSTDQTPNPSSFRASTKTLDNAGATSLIDGVNDKVADMSINNPSQEKSIVHKKIKKYL